MAKSKRKSLGEQLRECVSSRGFTVYRLAKDSGIPQPTLQMFMSGERGLRLETADKLAEFLGLEFRPIEDRAPARRKASRTKGLKKEKQP